jgi:hypothetical protein
MTTTIATTEKPAGDPEEARQSSTGIHHYGRPPQCCPNTPPAPSSTYRLRNRRQFTAKRGAERPTSSSQRPHRHIAEKTAPSSAPRKNLPSSLEYTISPTMGATAPREKVHAPPKGCHPRRGTLRRCHQMCPTTDVMTHPRPPRPWIYPRPQWRHRRSTDDA